MTEIQKFFETNLKGAISCITDSLEEDESSIKLPVAQQIVDELLSYFEFGSEYDFNEHTKQLINDMRKTIPFYLISKEG